MAEKSNYNLFFLLVLVIALTSLSASFQGIQFHTQVDEGYYFNYAVYIGEHGLSGFSSLFKAYLENQQHWFFPNPLRIAFISLSALWFKVFGPSFINLALFSLFLYLLFLGVSYCFSKKYFGGFSAVLFTALLAFSPLNMAMARRPLIESAVNLFSALSLWLFLDFLKERTKLKAGLFIIVYSLSILVKETSVLMSVVFLFFLFYEKLALRKGIGLKDFFTVTVFPFALVGLAYLILGCLPYFLGITKIILSSPYSNSYAIIYGSGPWFRYLIDYTLLSPWIVILSIGFIAYYFMGQERKDVVLYFIFVFLVSFIIFNIFTKNLRYVILLDMPMRLFSVFALKKLSERFFSRHVALVTISLVIMIAVSDYVSFSNLFLKAAIYDPTSFMLLKARHIIP
ncbi:MAG: glycosyltransferase family 39 protein [Candidatus Omnitrophica bacterium]|nr:glycosyltransferase family 39 protein [Candidatus Omnitrophota bacterium]